MSTKRRMKANLVAVATKNLGDLAKHVKVPTEIDHNTKDRFHVALVVSKNDPVKMVWSHKISVKIFDRVSFARHEKNFARLGYGKMFVFHNPTLEMDEAVSNPDEYKDEVSAVNNINAGNLGGEPMNYFQKKEYAKETLGLEFAANISGPELDELIKNAEAAEAANGGGE